MADQAPHPLVAALDRERKRAGLSHYRFAREQLGVSHSTWSLVFRGKVPPAGPFVVKVLARFPKMVRYIVNRGERHEPSDVSERNAGRRGRSPGGPVGAGVVGGAGG